MTFVHCSCVQQYGVEGPIICTHLIEVAGKGSFSGEVYTETGLGGRFFVHMRSVQRGGGMLGYVPINLLKIIGLNKYPW